MTTREIEEFAEWLFEQRKIDDEEILSRISAMADSKDTEEKEIVNHTIYTLQNVSFSFEIYQDKSTGHVRFIQYLKDGKELNAIEYFDNGQATCIFPRDENGNRHGKYNCYHENGSIRIIGRYDHGSLVKDEVLNVEPNTKWEE